MGTLYGQSVYDWEGPCSAANGRVWIHIPDFGLRHLLRDELLKLKGVDDSKFSNIPLTVLYTSVEQHVWVTLCKAIAPMLSSATSSTTSILHPTTSLPITPYHHITATSTWSWSMPDLSAGKAFYSRSIKNLKAAITHLNLDFDRAFREGLDTLAAHRLNYGS